MKPQAKLKKAMRKQCRLLCLTNNFLLRETVERCCKSHREFVSVGFFSDVEQAASKVKGADVLVLDLELGKTAFEFARMIPKVRKLAVCLHPDLEVLREATAAGICVVITCEDAPQEHLHLALTCLCKDACYFTSTLALLVSQLLMKVAEPVRPVEALCKREKEALGLLGQGLGRPEISKKMNISERTVDTHLDRAQRKLGKKRRQELKELAANLSVSAVAGT